MWVTLKQKTLFDSKILSFLGPSSSSGWSRVEEERKGKYLCRSSVVTTSQIIPALPSSLALASGEITLCLLLLGTLVW